MGWPGSGLEELRLTLQPDHAVSLTIKGSWVLKGILLGSLTTNSVLSPQQRTPCSAPRPVTTAGMACALTRASSVMGRITVKTTVTRKAVRVL